jgi:hypothetical protein
MYYILDLAMDSFNATSARGYALISASAQRWLSLAAFFAAKYRNHVGRFTRKCVLP